MVLIFFIELLTFINIILIFVVLFHTTKNTYSQLLKKERNTILWQLSQQPPIVQNAI